MVSCYLRLGFPLSRRFGHPRVLGIPIPKSLAFWASPSLVTAAFWASPRYPPGMPKSLQKNAGFRGKIENVLDMASAKYRNLFQYLKKKAYPEGFTKQENDSAKIFQKVRVWLKIRVLVLRGQWEGWHSASTTCYYQGRESVGLRRVRLCSFLWTRRPRQYFCTLWRLFSRCGTWSELISQKSLLHLKTVTVFFSPVGARGLCK